MKKTKKSLLFSGLALMMSALLLVGTTFAWFTDSVTNKGNTIESGTLDVALTPGEDTPLFNSDNNFVWEPGRSQVNTATVSNEGALWLKYTMSFANVVTKGTADITEVLDVYTVDADAKELTNAEYLGTMKSLMDTGSFAAKDNVLAPKGYQGDDGVSSQSFRLVIKMNENADNKYQNCGVNFDVVVNATQAAKETDGFSNPNYDANAQYEGVVSTSEELQAALNKGGKVVLDSDIVLTSPVVVPEGVTVSIDLGGKTISGRGIKNLGTITSLTNGNIVAESGYGLDNRATIGVLNCNVTSYNSDAINNGAGMSNGVIEEIAGGNYCGHAETYGSSITGACGLYNGSNAVVKLISGGYFQGSSTAFRSYNPNGIESVTGGFFDCPYMDSTGRTFCDAGTIDEVFYNYAPLSVTGGTWYNVGNKINSKIPDGYELVQGDVCTMTSGKSYVRYDAETQTPAHWVDDENGATYYYYTVKNVG